MPQINLKTWNNNIFSLEGSQSIWWQDGMGRVNGVGEGEEGGEGMGDST